MDNDLVITPAAAEFIKTALTSAQGEKPDAVRLSVKKAGCSGYEYIVEFAYEKRPFDRKFESFGATVVVDQEIFSKYFQGTVIDHRKEGLNIGLVFDNPNVEAKCGCGESFALKNTK